MVNREVNSTSPRSPAFPSRALAASPRRCQPKPRRHPRRGFWYLVNFRHGTRLVSPKFSGDRGSAARLPSPSPRDARRDSARAEGALPTSVRRVPAGRPDLPRQLRQFTRPLEVAVLRELVRNRGAVLDREFTAL